MIREPPKVVYNSGIKIAANFRDWTDSSNRARNANAPDSDALRMTRPRLARFVETPHEYYVAANAGTNSNETKKI